MKTIEINTSLKARYCLALACFALILLFYLAKLPLAIWLLIQIAAAGLIWRTWQSTLGLGLSGTLVLDKHWQLQQNGASSGRIVDFTPGLVTMAISTGTITTGHVRLPVLLLPDCTSEAGYWACRRLMLNGLDDPV